MKWEIVGCMAALLAVLKLLGRLRLSWLWVASPLWGNIALLVLVMGCVEFVRAAKKGDLS